MYNPLNAPLGVRWFFFLFVHPLCTSPSAGTGWYEHARQAVIRPWASHVMQSWVWAEADRCSAHDSLAATTTTAAMWVVGGKKKKKKINIKKCKICLFRDMNSLYLHNICFIPTTLMESHNAWCLHTDTSLNLHPSVSQVSVEHSGTWWEPWTGVTHY